MPTFGSPLDSGGLQEYTVEDMQSPFVRRKEVALLMRSFFCLHALFILIFAQATQANALGYVSGRMYDSGGNWGEMFVWASRANSSDIRGTFTDNLTGVFRMALEPGIYTFGFSRKFGLGPIILPGVTITDGTTTSVVLYYSDVYTAEGSEKIEGHTSYAQGFVSRGESVRHAHIRTDVPDSTDLIYAFREGSPNGNPVGPESVGGTWKHGEVRLQPGKTYFLTIRRKDNQPFAVVKSAPIPSCSAYADGVPLSDACIAGRIRADRTGIIVSSFPEFGTLCGTPCQKSFTQSFIAQGTSLAMLDFTPAIGDGRRTGTDYTIRILEGGLGGRQVGPTKVSRGSDYMAGSPTGFQLRCVLYNRDEVPLKPGTEYYIEISGEQGPFQVAANDGDFLGGRLYQDGQVIPGKCLDAVLVEYEPDDAPPPAPTLHAQQAGYAVQLSFDVPENMDVNTATVYRKTAEKSVALDTFYVCPGMTSIYVDRDVKPNSTYQYSVVLLDAAGNKSDAATATLTVKPITSDSNLLVNGEFVARGGSSGGGCPGWKTIAISKGADWSVQEKDGLFWLQTWNRGTTYDVAAYQLVPVLKGNSYKLTVRSNRWDPWGNDNVNVVTLVGIDSLGGSDPIADSVEWSAAEYISNTWATQTVRARALSDVITVFLRARAMYGGWDPGMRAAFANASLTIFKEASK